MLTALANLDHSDATNDAGVAAASTKPSMLTRFTNFFMPRNQVSLAVLEQILPYSIEETKQREMIGGILEYDGATVMIQPDEDQSRLGLEVRSGDLIFVTMDGVWFGTEHYADMPAVIEDYNFITSGTRDEYDELVEQKLQADLHRHNEVMSFLMAA